MPVYTSPFYILRSPLFPLSQLYNFYEVQPELKFEWLVTYFKSNHLALKAIRIASPSLFREFKNYIEDCEEDWNPKKRQELYNVLLKYFIRMTYRCTPFGLFASSSIVKRKEHQNKILEVNWNRSEEFLVNCRLSTSFWANVYTQLQQNKTLLNDLVYYTNNTLYKIDDVWKYIKIDFDGNMDSTDVFTVPDSPILLSIVEQAKEGVSIGEIVDSIKKEGYEEDDIRAYIDDLINNQIIVSELFPSVSGEDYHTFFMNRILDLTKNTYPEIYKAFYALKTALEKMSNDDSSIETIEHVNSIVNRILNKTNEDFVNPIQLDTYREIGKDGFSIPLEKDIQECVEVLSMITVESNDDLNHFKSIFAHRYEEQEIPLSVVLDEELGIGYQSRKLKSLNIFSANKGNRKRLDSISELKLNMYLEALEQQKYSIALKREDVEKLGNDPKIPDAYAIIGNVVHVDERDQFAFEGVSGPSSLNLLTRYASGNKDIEAEIQNLADLEYQPASNTIYAELSHLPNSKMGSLICRPEIRAYEIPYLVKSNRHHDQQIHINDLVVVMEGEELILMSKKLGKRIIPRLTTAHNYADSRNLPIYRFLGDLQQQNRNYIRWEWGMLSERPFLPRVEFKNIIVSPALWNIPKEALKRIKKKDQRLWLSAFETIKNKQNIPDFVLLSEADNNLLIDTRSQDGIILLIKEGLKMEGETVRLKEVLGNKDQLYVKDSQGFYTNELIIPYVKTIKEEEETQIQLKDSDKTILKRKFSPAEEWIYYKIYAEPTVINQVLIDALQGLCQTLAEEKKIQLWFFIRYEDPDYHLRIRFKLMAPEYASDVITRLNDCMEPWVSKNLVWNTGIHMYNRELERYGDKTIDLSEYLFYVNSNLVLNLNRIFSSNAHLEKYKRTVAIYLVDIILNAFTEDLNAKYAYTSVVRKSFSKEFGIPETNLKSANAHYREDRLMIEQIFGLKPIEDDVLKFLKTELESVSRMYKENIDRIIEIEYQGKDFTSMYTLASSHIHMFVNRFYTHNQRFFEYLAYGVLEMFYKSLTKRQNINRKILTHIENE